MRLAAGTLKAAIPSPSETVCLLSELPSHDFWLTCINVSGHSCSIDIRLPAELADASAEESGPLQDRREMTKNGRNCKLVLPPYEARFFVLHRKP